MENYFGYVEELPSQAARAALGKKAPPWDNLATKSELDRADLDHAFELARRSLPTETVVTEAAARKLSAVAGLLVRPSAHGGCHVELKSKKALPSVGAKAFQLADVRSFAIERALGKPVVVKALRALAKLTLKAIAIRQNSLGDLASVAPFTSLSELRLQPNSLKPAAFAKLRASKLDTLELSEQLGPAIAPEIAAIGSVTQLSFASSKLDKQAVATLASLPLTSLNLSGNPLKDGDLKPLSELPLRELAVTRVKLGKANVAAINSLSELAVLSANDCGLDSAAVRSILDEHAALESLDLAGNDLSKLSLAREKGLGELRRLNVSGADASLAGLDGLAKLRVLISNTDSNTDAVVAKLGTPKALVRLSLGAGKLGPKSAEAIARIATLRTLQLNGNPLGSKGLLALSKLGKLVVLELRTTRIDEKGAPALAQLESLRALDVGGNTMGDAAVDAVCKLKSLERLLLNNTGCTDAGAKRLSKLTTLRELSLVGNQVSKATLGYLQKALPDCSIEA